jgi:hypothetical protein
VCGGQGSPAGRALAWGNAGGRASLTPSCFVCASPCCLQRASMGPWSRAVCGGFLCRRTLCYRACKLCVRAASPCILKAGLQGPVSRALCDGFLCRRTLVAEPASFVCGRRPRAVFSGPPRACVAGGVGWRCLSESFFAGPASFLCGCVPVPFQAGLYGALVADGVGWLCASGRFSAGLFKLCLGAPPCRFRAGTYGVCVADGAGRRCGGTEKLDGYGKTPL